MKKLGQISETKYIQLKHPENVEVADATLNEEQDYNFKYWSSKIKTAIDTQRNKLKRVYKLPLPKTEREKEIKSWLNAA